VIKFTSGGSLRLPPPLRLHGRHDIAEILLKMALNTKVQIQIQILFYVRAKGIKDIKKNKKKKHKKNNNKTKTSNMR
jgi:hypothetical protein